jgi:hypothetical protein
MTDTPPTLASYTFSYQIPLKVNHDNYLSWKYFVLPRVLGHDLLDFLDGDQLHLNQYLQVLILPSGYVLGKINYFLPSCSVLSLSQ